MSNGDDVLDNWEEIDEAELSTKLPKLDRQIQDETKLEEIQTFLNQAPTDTTAGCAKTTDTAIPGTMKLLQRAAQTKRLPNNAVSASQQHSTPEVAQSAPTPFDDMTSTFQPVLMVLHKDLDEYQSANYAQPISTQTVKILRRPTQSTETRNNDVRPKQPIKTLQQREQEYAEARLRILGSAKNPEDDSAANVLPSTSSPCITTSTASVAQSITPSAAAAAQAQANVTNTNHTPSQAKVNVANARIQQQPNFGPIQSAYNNFYQQQQNLYYPKQQLQQQLQHSLTSGFDNNHLQFSNAGLLPTAPVAPVVVGNMQQRQQMQQVQHYHHQQQQQPQQQQQQSWSPVVGGSVSSFTLQRQQLRQPQQTQQQQTDLLRTPRGPDGSTGFQMRR